MRDNILTIGLPCHDVFDGPYFTVQSLRMYQEMRGVEVLLLDNRGDDRLYHFAKQTHDLRIRYVRDKAIQGTCYAKNRIFDLATTEYVMCMDSHVLLYPRVLRYIVRWLQRNPTRDLIHGPLIYDSLQPYDAACRWNDNWGIKMKGQWDKDQRQFSSNEPFEISQMGCGLFISHREAFARFHPLMRGFGIEEFYIHEKTRRAGNRVICHPCLKWVHRFNDTATYKTDDAERLRNYVIGWSALGWDVEELWPHFPGVPRPDVQVQPH